MTNVRLYCCGGAGGNIGKHLMNNPRIDVSFIDTSDSNLREVDSKNVYLVDDMDGAGKQRSKTYEGFKDLVNEVLTRFKPNETLNIVISSLSGGSGSIIAPLITRELLENDQSVFVIGMDSRNSTIEIKNSIDTLMTYHSISEKLQKSICLRYIKNTSRREADEFAKNLIDTFSIISNRKMVEEFDSTDIRNFLNFDKVTDNDPSLAILELNRNITMEDRKGVNYASTIMITKDPESTIADPLSRPDYLATCLYENSTFDGDIRLDCVTGYAVQIVEDLKEEMQELQERRTINKVKKLEGVDSTSDGIVF